MNIGMLWFDNDPKTDLEKKVERAATYYRSKYGKNPTLCYVHPSMLPAAEPAPVSEAEATPAERERLQSAGVEVRTAATILPHHFWIGINSLPLGAD